MDSTRTIAFVVSALIAIGAAAFTHKAYQPAAFKEVTDEGTEFFPDYKDPNEATGLRVAHYNADQSKVEVFEVKNDKGKWTIPTHNDYPADGETRLKDTAASVVGVKRQTLAGKSKDDHKKFGLLDPLDDKVSGTEGRGDRITLFGSDKELCDLIVGKKTPNSQSDYYVRRVGEEPFYITDLSNFSVSTKFTDWIQADLLNLSALDIKEVTLDRYKVDESLGKIVQGEKSRISRETSTADWKLADLDETISKVKATTISSLTSALDNIKIVGVRKKPAGLSSDLKTDEGISLTTSIALDLQDKGFFFSPKDGLVSNEGESIVGTFDGVLYILRFGEVFTGSDVELEVGRKAGDEKKDDTKKDDAKQDAAADDKKDETQDGDEAKPDDPSVKKSRYAFITCQFDEELLGPAPIKPEEPKKPEPAAAPPATAPAAAPAADAAAAPVDPAAAPAATPPAADDPAKAAEAKKADDEAAYKKALDDYKLQLEVHETKTKERDKKVEAGKKRVQELNARFADWYYVISDDLFKDLSHERSALFEPKDPPKVTAPGGASLLEGLNLPGVTPPMPATAPVSPPSEPMPDSPPAPPTKTESDAKSAEGDSAPAEGDAKSAKGDAAPAEGDAKPAEGEAKPAEGEAKPTEGDAQPADGDAK